MEGRNVQASICMVNFRHVASVGLFAASGDSIRFRAKHPSPEPVDRSATAQVADSQPQPAVSQPVETAYYPPSADAASRRTYDGPIIPAGTPLHVRLDESLGTKHDSTGERFYASLADPIVMNGKPYSPSGPALAVTSPSRSNPAT